MTYPLQRRFKPDSLLPQEIDVVEALREYSFTTATALDFTPTGVLYATYLAGAVGRLNALTEIQFGAALRRAFGLTDARQSRRRVNGRLTMGYAGVRGPGSIVVQAKAGNPNLKQGRLSKPRYGLIFLAPAAHASAA